MFFILNDIASIKKRGFSSEKHRFFYGSRINYANNDQVPQGIRAKIRIKPRM